jgi:hypothetical protein
MKQLTKRHIRTHSIASSALAGVAVIAIVQLASVSSLSTSLLIAVLCFSISLPFLTATLFIIAHLDDRPSMSATSYYATLAFAGHGLSLTGIAALFFHFHYAAGVMFIITSVTAIALAAAHYSIDDPNKE